MDIVLFYDGLCEPKNPGGCGCWGYVLWLGTKKKFVDCGHLGNPEWMTNNYSEYCSLGFGLKAILDMNLQKIDSLTILGDSMLVACQVSGKWKVKSELLQPLHKKCIEYLDKLPVSDWVIRWIPRWTNEEADELGRKAYEEWLK
jgi:ribonuclease HI